MYPSVRAAFPAFIRLWEGFILCMYLDMLGLVTVGFGNLIDSTTAALALGWVWKATGAPASSSAVMAEWTRVKGLQAQRGAGGGHFETDARLHVTPESLAGLVTRTLERNAVELSKPGRFPGFPSAPADAQLALLRMAWAMGYGFVDSTAEHPSGRWPAFHAAFNACDWMGCSRECRMREEKQPREFVESNAASVVLFENACAVWEGNLDRDVIYWPRALLREQPAPSA